MTGNMLRLRYRKVGKAKYISHLDLMETIRRSLLRTGISLEYSQGFNPHPYISVALPLSIGSGSECELLDFKTSDNLLPDGLSEMINNSLPEGIEILEVYTPTRKFRDIAWLELRGFLFYDANPSDDIVDILTTYYKKDSIIITKKTKRGESEIDIAPHFCDMRFAIEDEVTQNTPRKKVYQTEKALTMSVKVSAQEPTINHEHILNALVGEYSVFKPDFSLFTRIETYDDRIGIFR